MKLLVCWTRSCFLHNDETAHASSSSNDLRLFDITELSVHLDMGALSLPKTKSVRREFRSPSEVIQSHEPNSEHMSADYFC